MSWRKKRVNLIRNFKVEAGKYTMLKNTIECHWLLLSHIHFSLIQEGENRVTHITNQWFCFVYNVIDKHILNLKPTVAQNYDKFNKL